VVTGAAILKSSIVEVTKLRAISQDGIGILMTPGLLALHHPTNKSLTDAPFPARSVGETLREGQGGANPTDSPPRALHIRWACHFGICRNVVSDNTDALSD
jgi:hypothetical protein